MSDQPLFVLLRRAEVMRMTGLANSTIYYLVARGEFPKPVPISRNTVGWLASEIEAWLKDRLAEREKRGRVNGRGKPITRAA